MASPGSAPSQVPPGFRFHPTDEELVNYYLRKKVAGEKFDLDVIRDVDLNKLEPWDLQERCRIDSRQQTEWYFFSHKDKKYPTGTRTNRATTAGFWKATGRDKAVHSSLRRVGMRKTLVFYTGRAPHGQKTDWIMHEYRLDDCETGIRANEDGWVVCRVFKKRIHPQKVDQDQSRTFIVSEEEQSSLIDSNLENSNKTFRVDQGAAVAVSTGTFFCKQEVEFDDLKCYNSQVPFLHLPQLESPKNTCNFSSLNSISSGPHHGRRVFPESYCKRSELFPSPFPLEMPTLDYSSNLFAKSLLSCEDNLTDSYVVDDRHLNEWNNVLETMNPREMRFSSELSNFSSELPALPQLGSSSRAQQTPDSFAPNSDVDLWSFIR